MFKIWLFSKEKDGFLEKISYFGKNAKGSKNVADCAWKNKLLQSLENWVLLKKTDGSFERKYWIISRTAEI